MSAAFEAARPLNDPQLTLLANDPPAEEWHIRESARARRLTVRVSFGGEVEVIVPRRTARRTIELFLNRHRKWIEQKCEEARRSAHPPQPFPPQQIELSATAEKLRVHLSSGKGPTRVHLLAPGLLGISGNSDDPAKTRVALQRWLAIKAKHVLEPWLVPLAGEMGTSFTKLTIRLQRTRWGSCSTRGTISLNCCLLFQRPEVVRYLLIHELAHTQHMNHSKRFWRYVEQHCANYRQLDRELVEGWRQVPSWAIAT